MPPRKRTSSVVNDDNEDDPIDVVETTDQDDALALAEEAEAEAAAAEAAAAAARARARALKLRRQAEAAAAAGTTGTAVPAPTEPTAPAAQPISEPEPAGSVPGAETGTVERVDLAKPTATEPDSSVDEDLDADEDLDEAEDVPRRRRRLSVPRVPLKYLAAALVLLCTVVLLVLSVLMMVHHRGVEADRQRSAEFAAAARQGVVTLMSLDFNRAEDDVKRILENTTGEFKKDFESQAPDFTRVAQESKVVTEATVNATAVEKMGQDTATVLVAVTTNVSNAASKEQQPRSWRLSVDVARDGGQIKLAKVEFVP